MLATAWTWADDTTLDLTIRAGARVLLDGPSGIGKSTLAALAARLAAPAPGARVFLDGEDVAGLDPAALRRAVAVVPLLAMAARLLAETGTAADTGITPIAHAGV